MSSAPVTITTPVPDENIAKSSSGLSTGIRISISLLIAIMLGLFILLWDGGYIPTSGIPVWIGNIVFMPILAVVLGYGADCLIQYLSCGTVEWLVQLQRIAVVPIPFLFMSFVLYIFPILRWPIEGLVQHTTPSVRYGLSSGFYTFWTALYTQSFLIGLSQLCPS